MGFMKKIKKVAKKATTITNKVAKVTAKAGNLAVKAAPFVPPPGDTIALKGGQAAISVSKQVEYAGTIANAIAGNGSSGSNSTYSVKSTAQGKTPVVSPGDGPVDTNKKYLLLFFVVIAVAFMSNK